MLPVPNVIGYPPASLLTKCVLCLEATYVHTVPTGIA
jgi:hypothetical protein